MTIYTQTIGTGKDIVILHGWGACSHKTIMPIVTMLQDHYRVTVIDLPGRGNSDWNNNIHTIPDMAESIMPVLPDKAIVIGWSFGGQIAMALAANHSGRVERLICFGSTPKFVADAHWPGIPKPGFQAAFNEVKKDAEAFFRQGCEAEVEGMANATQLAKTMHKELIDEIGNTDIMFKGVLMIDASDMRELFSNLQCPIDMVYGELDPAIPTSQHQQVEQLNSNVHSHIINDARHFFFFTHPAETRSVLQQIL